MAKITHGPGCPCCGGGNLPQPPCDAVTISKPIDEQNLMCAAPVPARCTQSVKITGNDVVVTGPAFVTVFAVLVRTVEPGECPGFNVIYSLTLDSSPVGVPFDTGVPAFATTVVLTASFTVGPGGHFIGIQVDHPGSACFENIAKGGIKVDAQCVGTMRIRPTLS